MSQTVRRAGRVRLGGGTVLVWSVADGRRGRRWRAMTSREDRLVESLLLEVDRKGRPTRLEITNVSGLLTLHPEPSGMLHGNVVTSSGMRHLALGWSDDHELAIDRLPIAEAVAVNRLSHFVGVGEGIEVDVVAVTDELEAHQGRRRYERLSEAAWRVERDGETRHLAVDQRGLPIWADGGGEPVEWPLELGNAT